MTELFFSIFSSSVEILREASIYILIGITAGGMLRVFLSPEYVASRLGKGRFMPVFRAAILGIPLPLCSCGVLPAAASLKKQGANNGATVAFLISTPESGIDSIAITWALLDPVMTVARPVAAFISAVMAGCAENFFHIDTSSKNSPQGKTSPVNPMLIKPTETPPGNLLQWNNPVPLPDAGTDMFVCTKQTDDEHATNRFDPASRSDSHDKAHTYPCVANKIIDGLKYAFGELWGDLAPWFFAGILIAGIINAMIPDSLITEHLGGGVDSMLLMLLFSIPLYICATASTPIAAALIMKGISPGTALVFLLAGPATNITSLTVLTGILGKTSSIMYLIFIALTSIACGLLLDMFYAISGIPVSSVIGMAAGPMPPWLMDGAAMFLVIISIPVICRKIKNATSGHDSQKENKCGCNSCN